MASLCSFLIALPEKSVCVAGQRKTGAARGLLEGRVDSWNEAQISSKQPWRQMRSPHPFQLLGERWGLNSLAGICIGGGAVSPSFFFNSQIIE